MRFLFVTYRWGEDLLGGAELHHRRLAEELRDLGHEVVVLTTTGHEVRTFCHWGIEWSGLRRAGAEDGPIPVHRVPMKRRARWQLALAAKALQWKMEREEHDIRAEFLLELTGARPGQPLLALNGWHYPEMREGLAIRWTHRVARMMVRVPEGKPGRLVLRGHAPKRRRVLVRAEGPGGGVFAETSAGPGWFEVSASIPAGFVGIVSLELDGVWRPQRDFRGLGLLVEEAVLEVEGADPFRADLGSDYRALGRARPREWQAFLLERARRRHPLANRLIGFLRGPQANITSALLDSFKADWVIHCNLPWANMELVRKGDLAMPLWHVEDEFYYWQPWIDALRRARFVLANTPYTAREFFPPLGIEAHFVAPPIWEPEETPSGSQIAAFRARFGIAPEETLVLTVCRKSPEKGYETLAASVERLRRGEVAIRMVGAGPDIDGRPLLWDGCAWAGKLLGPDLQIAYAACDVFCLMSESESFGMVIPEAWHHAKPVVVNRLCGPAASLVDEGQDGLLAEAGSALDGALRTLATDAALRKRLGEAGREKARRSYTRGASAKRLLHAIESAARPDS